MKTIKVAAAVIIRDSRVFAVQRGYGEYKDWWEFPGGKVEAGETSDKTIVREIKEELGTLISADKLLCTVEYDYPKFHLTMHCFICELVSEDIVLKEHSAARWLDKAGLDTVEWLPADEGLIEQLKNLIKN